MSSISDGVFAVAMTLLTFNLVVPTDSHNLWKSVAEQWPTYLAYAVSFVTIGAIWLSHSTITNRLADANPILMRINLFVLFAVSFLPFPTRLLASYIGQPSQERVAATIYGVNLMLITASLASMWLYALDTHLTKSDGASIGAGVLKRRLVPSLVVYLLLIGVGLIYPTLALVGYLALAAYLMLPIHALLYRRRVTGK